MYEHRIYTLTENAHLGDWSLSLRAPVTQMIIFNQGIYMMFIHEIHVYGTVHLNEFSVHEFLALLKL